MLIAEIRKKPADSKALLENTADILRRRNNFKK